MGREISYGFTFEARFELLQNLKVGTSASVCGVCSQEEFPE